MSIKNLFIFGALIVCPALSNSASACMVAHHSFVVVDGVPSILPAELHYFRVQPPGGGWPQKSYNLKVQIIGDERGPSPPRLAILKPIYRTSSCQDFAQSERSSFVVGSEAEENGVTVIRAVTLVDTTDLRFIGSVVDVEQLKRVVETKPKQN